MITDLTILTLSNLPLEDKLKEKFPLLENIMNNQQESQNQSEALVTLSLPKKMTRWLVNIEDVMVNNKLSTIWWAGYSFKFEELEFEDGLITDKNNKRSTKVDP